MNFKVAVLVLVTGTCLIACENKSNSESAKKTDTTSGETSPAKAAGGPTTKYFSPLIFDGHISTMTPTPDAAAKEFYSVHWGDSQKYPYFTEQTLLCKTSLPALKMVEFPNTLPMALNNIGPLKVYWQFGRKADSTPSGDNIKFGEFFEYAKTLSNGNDDKFLYAVTIASPNDGPPPSPDTHDLDATVKGVYEAFSVPELDCSGSLFAFPFGDPSDFDKGVVKGAYQRRRILEAISEKCANLDPEKLKGKIATIGEVNNDKTYQQWYDDVSKWPNAKHADGIYVYAKSLPATKAEAEAIRDMAIKILSK